MFTKVKRGLLLFLVGIMLFSCVACGNKQTGDTENNQGLGSEIESESEIEKKVEIVDATDILTKVWNSYETEDTDGNRYNDRFAIMGGHFESAVMDMPAKYDLTQTSDLELMYCVPQSSIVMIDDAATMVHLMVASTFTAGAYHVTDAANVKTVVDEVKQQIIQNHWLDGFPDEYLIMTVDDQYVISAIGNVDVVDNFETILKEIYGKQVTVQMKESVR
ncbi:MAG: hypothetical protein IJ455_05175 [Agathobacter sp.]|nr:hypothetical protein [Agathobacter sp.]